MKNIIINHLDGDISLKEIESNLGMIIIDWNSNSHYTVQALIDKIKELSEKPKEYIICSSIWYEDLHLVKPEVLEPRGFRPYNITKGVVVSGWRHSNCIYQICAITGLAQHECGNSIQGFLTNTNRFVDRKEAYLIAKGANQIIEPIDHDMGILTSENLY